MEFSLELRVDLCPLKPLILPSCRGLDRGLDRGLAFKFRVEGLAFGLVWRVLFRVSGDRSLEFRVLIDLVLGRRVQV